MNTYESMKIVIAGGKKSKEELLTISDVFLMNNRVTTEQYNELVELINN